MMKSKKILALIVSLVLVLNIFAGLSLTSSAAAPGWVWYPATHGYSAPTSLTAVDNTADNYTTFTVTATDGFAYPGINAGDVSATTGLGVINATANKYIAVKYRTSASGGVGEILANGGAYSMNLPAYTADGQWHTLIAYMQGAWTGNITWFRLDYLNNLSSGSIDIASVAFCATLADAEAFAGIGDASYDKVIDISFNADGVVDKMNGKYGAVTGSAKSYTQDDDACMYVANLDNVAEDKYAIYSGNVPASALEVMAATSTYEVYFNISSSLAEEGIFSSCEGAGLGMYGVTSGGDTDFIAIVRDNSGAYVTLTYENPTLGEWCHLVLVINGTTATLYADGVAVDTKTLVSAVVWTNGAGFTPNKFVVGGDYSTGGVATEYADTMSVGFARAYAKAWTAQQVEDAYNSVHSTETEMYNVSVGTVTNGTVTATPTGEVEEGTTVTVTATPADGYQLDQVLVNGSPITGTTFTVTGDSVITASFTDPTAIVGNILIDTMNANIWAQPYKTIIFDDTYAGPYRGQYQYTLVCVYNSVLGKYVVEQKYVSGDATTTFSLAPNQIIINAVGSSESYTASKNVWDAAAVGSVLTLSGVDLVNKTVAAGAYASVQNNVAIPDDPNKGTEYEGSKITGFQTSIDVINDDGDENLTGGAGGVGTVYQGGTYDIDTLFGISGWAATDNGIDRYEFSLDRLNFTKIDDAVITARDDLAGANIPYVSGHSTAGFSLKIPASAFGEDGTYNLTIRAVDKADNYFDVMTVVVNVDVPENADNNNNNDNQSGNAGTDDSVAVVFVMMIAVVAMAAVVLKRKKEF